MSFTRSRLSPSDQGFVKRNRGDLPLDRPCSRLSFSSTPQVRPQPLCGLARSHPVLTGFFVVGRCTVGGKLRRRTLAHDLFLRLSEDPSFPVPSSDCRGTAHGLSLPFSSLCPAPLHLPSLQHRPPLLLTMRTAFFLAALSAVAPFLVLSAPVASNEGTGASIPHPPPRGGRSALRPCSSPPTSEAHRLEQQCRHFERRQVVQGRQHELDRVMVQDERPGRPHQR